MQKLLRKYNPRTMALGVRILGGEVNHGKIKQLNEIGVVVNK